MPSQTIRWLHLSDFHVGMDDYAQPLLFDYIITHVRKLKEDGFVPDFIFVTGDLADKGKSSEYEIFWLKFLKPLQEAIGDGIVNRTFVIAGNHDVDRKQNPHFDRLEMAEAKSHCFDASPEGKTLRQMLMPRFKAFADNDCTTVKGALDTEAGSFATTIEIRGLKIGITGINTAWLCKDNDDERKLTLGKSLLEHALGKLSDSKLRIVLGHHPLDWLIPTEQKAVKSLLGQHSALYLHGHLHDVWAEPAYGGGYQFLAIQSGAAFQAREGEKWRNGLVWGEADLTTQELKLQPRQWSLHHQDWQLAADAFPEHQRKEDWWIYPLPGAKLALEENDLGDLDIFDVPQFVDLANRTALKFELNNLLLVHPIVSVAGLSDSGKSFLVASFLNNHSQFKNRGSVIWHEPEPSGGEPLEVLIARLEQPLKLSGKSLFEKSKQLMRQLEANNQLLVIDDFHSVDHGSYAALIEAASRLKAPARLLLISQTNIGMTAHIPNLLPLEVSGYNHGELRHFLIEKQLSHLSENVIGEFLEKTDGLPIAADWFAFMIKSLKRSPEQLLSGSMLVTNRLRNWFNQIEESIGKPASNMLRMLSLCDGPFNLGVVRMLNQQAGSEIFEELFETLQRAYLVQSYSLFRWRLHQLIVELCQDQMSEEFERGTHLSLGIYHRDNAQGVARRFSEDKALIWQVKACRHLQKSGDYARWNKTVHRTIRMLKPRGFYRLIVQLLGKELRENPSKDPWLAYSYAHACLIMGWHEPGMAIVKPLVGHQMQNDPSLKISIVRLYADLLDATGEPRLALDKLQELLSSNDTKLAHDHVIAQVKAAVVRLLTKLEEYDQAEKLSEKMLAERKDNIGRAVALAGWGIVLKCTGRFELADIKLAEAVNLFMGKDNRGYGWSLSHHAICQQKLGNIDGASLMLREALRVRSEIEEASAEYILFLRSALPSFQDKDLTEIIEAEIERASAQIKVFGK